MRAKNKVSSPSCVVVVVKKAKKTGAKSSWVQGLLTRRRISIRELDERGKARCQAQCQELFGNPRNHHFQLRWRRLESPLCNAHFPSMSISRLLLSSHSTATLKLSLKTGLDEYAWNMLKPSVSADYDGDDQAYEFEDSVRRIFRMSETGRYS